MARRPAELRYRDADVEIVRPGSHVFCAVSGVEIPLAQLAYWNVDRQEAYAGPREAMKRWQELHGAEEGRAGLSSGR